MIIIEKTFMITIFDNFIKDENFLDEIGDNETFFSDPGVYYYWDGWWNSEVNSIKKRLIEYICKDNRPLTHNWTINGFEYWTGVQEADPNGRFRNYLEMHTDEDEAYRIATGKRIYPVIGCVYYPPGSEFTGGALNVYTDGGKNPPDIALCRPNRLIIFNAGGVLHKVDTILTGTRRAIAINIWDKAPYSKTEGLFKTE